MNGSPEVGRRSPLRLRAAVERLLAERAAAKAAAPCNSTAVGRKVPAALHRRRRLSHLSLTLRDPRQLPAGELPAAQLLDAALAVLTQGRHRPGDWRLEGWFFGVALRAVCEAILEDGRLTLPIAVVLETHPHKETWPPMPPIPQPAFSRSGERHAGEPLRLRIRRTEPACPGEPPLTELLDAALNVLASGYHRAGRWRQERWFLRQGLLAVCEAVLTSKTGHLPLPLRVRLYRRDNLAARTALPTRVRALALAFQSINPPPGR